MYVYRRPHDYRTDTLRVHLYGDVLVLKWPDQQNSNDALQAVNADQASDNTILLRPAWLFDGATDYFDFPATTYAGVFSFAVALERSDTTSLDPILGTTDDITINTDATISVAGASFDIPEIVPAGVTSIIIVTRDSSDDVSLYYNGTASSSNPQSVSGTVAFSRVGNDGGGSNWFSGKIGELLLWGQDLDDSGTRSATHTILNNKWNSVFWG